MDKESPDARYEAFRVSSYLTSSNVAVRTYVRAAHECMSIHNISAPMNCIGVITNVDESEPASVLVTVEWDIGRTATYDIMKRAGKLYTGTLNGRISPLIEEIPEPIADTPIYNIENMPADMLIGKLVRLKQTAVPSSGTYTNGILHNTPYTVEYVDAGAIRVVGHIYWIAKHFFELSTGNGPITTKPMNDENIVNFNHAINSSKDERHNTDRYKVPRPIAKIGRKQESRGGAISGRRGVSGLGQTNSGY